MPKNAIEIVVLPAPSQVMIGAAERELAVPELRPSGISTMDVTSESARASTIGPLPGSSAEPSESIADLPVLEVIKKSNLKGTVTPLSIEEARNLLISKILRRAGKKGLIIM